MINGIIHLDHAQARYPGQVAAQSRLDRVLAQRLRLLDRGRRPTK
jgi:hypothetical protein